MACFLPLDTEEGHRLRLATTTKNVSIAPSLDTDTSCLMFDRTNFSVEP
jgi:hypothetical protein